MANQVGLIFKNVNEKNLRLHSILPFLSSAKTGKIKLYILRVYMYIA